MRVRGYKRSSIAARDTLKRHRSVRTLEGCKVSEDTIFGRIVRGELPVERVFEDDVCLAFADIAPVAPVHFLVIPKHAVASLGDVSAAHDAMLCHLLRVAGELGQQHCPGGFRVVTNAGSDAGQSVDYLHLHVLGGRHMAWPPG